MKQIKHFQYIYWFAAYNLDCPSTRYRGKIPLEYLEANSNIKSQFVFPDRSLNGVLLFLKVFISALLFRKKNSLIVIQKVCSNGVYANALKILVFFQSKNTRYDLDDAEYLRRDDATLIHFASRCESIIVGSESLKSYCLQYNRNISILTSPIKDHKVFKSKRNSIPNIGWVGDLGKGDRVSQNFSHRTSLFEILFPQLKLIDSNIILTLIGVKDQTVAAEILNYFNTNPKITVNILKDLNWKSDDWVYDQIANFDIGVSPMTDHPFNQSKSAFKSKQYLSVGVPVVCSDVGENKNFTLTGQNGFLCLNSSDFLDAINLISAMSDEEYFEMSRNAMHTKTKFSMENYCSRLIEQAHQNQDTKELVS